MRIDLEKHSNPLWIVWGAGVPPLRGAMPPHPLSHKSFVIAIYFDMVDQIEIVQTKRLDVTTIAHLVEESSSQEFRFVERLVQDYQTGKNCFDKTGEALFGVFFEKKAIAIGGLNQDPYVNSDDEKRVGRLRHVYVMSDWRRQGIGCLLVERLIEAAIPYFDTLTLRTDTSIAAKFYQKLGFKTTSQWQHTTHVLDLSERTLQRS